MSARVIGLSGFGGTGKDSVRDILEKEYGYKGGAFADALRKMALFMDPYFPETQCTYVELVQQLGYDSAKRLHKCVRDYLVKLGEGARQSIGPTVWIDALLVPSKLQAEWFDKPLVVSDVRYPNEAKRIHELGGVVVRITRPGVNAAHPTEEESLAATPYTYLLENDGTLDDLKVKVQTFLTSLR